MRHSSESLSLRPGRSRYLLAWLALLHTTAWLVWWGLDLGWPGKDAIALCLLGYLGWQLRQLLLRRGRRAVLEARCQVDGRWRLTLGNGERPLVVLRPGGLVTPWLTVLRFGADRWSPGWWLSLWPDSLDPELARRLRIHLKGHQEPSSSALSGGV